MGQDFKLKAAQHAETEYPKEAAGLVVDGNYFPCKNKNEDLYATSSVCFVKII